MDRNNMDVASRLNAVSSRLDELESKYDRLIAENKIFRLEKEKEGIQILIFIITVLVLVRSYIFILFYNATKIDWIGRLLLFVVSSAVVLSDCCLSMKSGLTHSTQDSQSCMRQVSLNSHAKYSDQKPFNLMSKQIITPLHEE